MWSELSIRALLVLLVSGLSSACVLSAKGTPCTGETCITEGDEIECDTLGELPDELLATCFAEVAEGHLAPNLRPFEPQYEMFTGDVTKRRWIYLPPGSRIDTTNVDAWEFPTGTILWLEVATGDRIETQMLEKNGLGIGRGAWRAGAYLWTADQTDAHRARREGESYTIDGVSDWSEPDEATCMDCHQAPDDVTLGFSALQLSDATRAGSVETWSDYLTDPQEPVAIVGSAADQRVLGSLHANCGTCHSPRGIVAGLDLDLSYTVATTGNLEASNTMLTGLYKDLRIVPSNVGGSSVYALLASGAMPPDRRTSAIDEVFRVELVAWMRSLEWPTRITVDAPATIDAGTPDDHRLFGYEKTISDGAEGVVFSRAEPYNFRSRVVIPVDPALTYRVSGRFRSNGVTPSRFYFGLAPFDAEGEFISAYRANRQGALAAIDRDSTTSTTITTTTLVDDWNPSTGAGYLRAVGIYYDGDTTKLPDHVHTSPDHTLIGPEYGAYNTALGTTITLNVELPEDVLAQMTDQTVVANHYSGSTYLYTAASAAIAGPDWTEFSGELTGTAFSATPVQFRPQTAFAKFIILANHRQPGEATELLFDDLRLEVVTP